MEKIDRFIPKLHDDFNSRRPELVAALLEVHSTLSQRSIEELCNFEIPPYIRELRRRKYAAQRAHFNHPTRENKRNLWKLNREVKAAFVQYRKENEQFEQVMRRIISSDTNQPS
ncbi:jg1773 [Pararge aegeria aegeria]|uniref:Jg1773 protein n=1 Tax=Pararge aegeria aegeria TaxID=348720 RepID=A0A8S4RTV8_9NEOP|nr:jg1773 [Pararge aegeria aegeria]